jgi:hypothetical protein
MRWEAWPALMATLAWGLFLIALVVAYAPGGAADPLAPLLLAGMPLAVALRALVGERRSAARDERSSAVPGKTGRLARLGFGLVLGLVAGAFALELLGTARSSSFDVGLEGPLTVGRLLPGPSEAWAYLAALALTVGAVAGTLRVGLLTAASLAVGALVGSAVLSVNASALVPATGAGADAAGGCRDPLTVPLNVRSSATGELDGVPLGRVELRKEYQPGVAPGSVLVVRYDTGWGSGVAQLPAPTTTSRDPLEVVTLSREARLTVDDLGVDVIASGDEVSAARHCRLMVDGPAALAGFPALRWLSGADERTADPGVSLEAWRGTLDYWLVTTGEARFEGVDVLLAAVSVDGQPRGWPFAGLHATLRAASWYGEPFRGPRITGHAASGGVRVTDRAASSFRSL